MSTDGLTLNSAPFEAAIVRLAMTSKKAAAAVMKDQARLLFVEVAKITPPYSGGVTGRQAEKQGRTAVARDIYGLYGTRSDAYSAIAASNVPAANAFWSQLGQGNTDLASSILRDVTGKSLSPFDGGALHERSKGGSRRRTRRANAATRNARSFVFFVSNAEALAAYVNEKQAHVWWLASGWADPLRAIGSKVPDGVGKLAAPGKLKVTITDQRIEITMSNQVSYGRGVRDIQRRIDFAMNKRVGALDRRWESYLNRAAKDAGFSKSL